MGLEINSNQLKNVGAQANFFVNALQKYATQPNIPNTYITPEIKPDSVSVNTDLYKYINQNAISEMIKVNSEIKRILEEFKIPLKINMNVLHDLVKNHLPKTKKTTLGIANKLPSEYKSKVNFQAIQKASVLHDYGKVLIPQNILNKKGHLTEEEFKIMKQHSNLGYELLKSTDLDEETLNLIKNHHQNAQKTGYPEVEGDFVSDINLQILSAADIYEALREKRPYKKELSKNEALAILHKEMKDGKIHPYVFKALVDYANDEDERLKLSNLDSNRKVFNLKPVDSLSA